MDEKWLEKLELLANIKLPELHENDTIETDLVSGKIIVTIAGRKEEFSLSPEAVKAIGVDAAQSKSALEKQKSASKSPQVVIKIIGTIITLIGSAVTIGSWFTGNNNRIARTKTTKSTYQEVTKYSNGTTVTKTYTIETTEIEYQDSGHNPEPKNPKAVC